MEYFRMLMLVGCFMTAGVWSSCVGDDEIQTCGSSLMQISGSVEKTISARNMATLEEDMPEQERFRTFRGIETMENEMLAMTQEISDSKGNLTDARGWKCYMRSTLSPPIEVAGELLMPKFEIYFTWDTSKGSWSGPLQDKTCDDRGCPRSGTSCEYPKVRPWIPADGGKMKALPLQTFEKNTWLQ